MCKFWLLLLVFTATLSFSQDQDTTICDFPDKEAQYPGGTKELMRFLNSNFEFDLPTCLPELGKIYLEFIVKKDGSITNIKILKGMNEEYDREAIILLKKMPNWIPAELNGKAVRSLIRIPVTINLN